MGVVEAEAAPRRVTRRPVIAGIRQYLDAHSIALGATAVLAIGLLSWNVLLQDQVRDLRGQVDEAPIERPERQVQGSRTSPFEGRGPSRAPAPRWPPSTRTG